MAEREPIGVVGAGWVGLVTAACFAELGHPVVVREIVPEKVESLRRGEVPIHEPGLLEMMERNRERLAFTTEMTELLGGARLLFVCVGTPPTYSGDADLSAVQRAVEEIGEPGGKALVMKSTVPVGTGRTIRRDAPDLAYVSCPEFLREGTAVKDFLEPDRVVIGVDSGDDWAADAVAAVYEPLGVPIVHTDLSSAEMIKLASNAYLATKISFINEIANVCDEVGADVTEVSRGMGLDPRIGDRFLNAGLGFGGSCLIGDETVLVRRQGRVWSWSLAELFEQIADEQRIDAEKAEFLQPDELEVLSLQPGASRPEFLPVTAATRRPWEGELVEVKTKMGRRVSCTPDHPFVVADANGENIGVKVAAELGETDWLPLADGAPACDAGLTQNAVALSGMVSAGLQGSDVIVRVSEHLGDPLHSLPLEVRRKALKEHPRGHAQRFSDIKRSGSLRLDEAVALGLSVEGATAATARSGTYVPFNLELDERFWRIVGLYVAEGHCTVDGRHRRHRLQWSFHPFDEMHLVDEVAEYWRSMGVKATVRRTRTAMTVSVSSKLLGEWWVGAFGLGRNCYGQRVPDALWQQDNESKKQFLAGMWLGDGSWSYVNGGPNVVLEYGTASYELVDGLLRLLSEVGTVASLRIGRTAKSTQDNYWVRVSGADQIERSLFLAPSAERAKIRSSLRAQKKRIAPTGYRRHSDRGTWVRVVDRKSRRFSGDVYSLEVPGAHTFVTTGGLVVHNCFPKDTQALKILAGNSGYHFQLLSSVIEVNELQKRRVMSKLTKHLDSLVGKRVALLGLAFKPDTDDMREASSLVLAARLEGEGATVTAFDPIAASKAAELLPTVEMAGSALQALDGADAAVLVTEWPEFTELDWAAVAKRMANPLLVDGRNFLDPEAVRAAGITYEAIGRPSAPARSRDIRVARGREAEQAER